MAKRKVFISGAGRPEGTSEAKNFSRMKGSNLNGVDLCPALFVKSYDRWALLDAILSATKVVD